MVCPDKFCCISCSPSDEKVVANITKKRKCTDTSICILYVVSWFVAIWLVVESANLGGDPNRIIRGIDMEGRVCGIDDGVKDKPLAAWPYPLEYEPKICVENCAHTNSPFSRDMAWRHRSVKLLYYCLPVFVSQDTSVQIKVTGNVGEQFNSAGAMFGRMIGDLETSWRIILASAFVAMVITFIFLFFLQYMAGFLVFLCIALLIAGGSLLGYTLIALSNDVDVESMYASEKAKILNISGHIAYIGTGIFFLVVIALFFQIRIAVEVIKEGARAINDMKGLMFFPLLPMFLVFAYVALWISGALVVVSPGNFVTKQTPPAVMEYGYGFLNVTEMAKNMIPGVENDPNRPVFGESNGLNSTYQHFQREQEDFRINGSMYFFHLLWTAQFIFYFGLLVIAGALADWYFTPRGPHGKKIWDEEGIHRNPVLASMKRTCRYHLGTVSTAALIIAIIQFLQFVILYIEKQTKNANGEPNGIQKAVFCAIKCFLKCVECCMDKINKNALIWTAIYGQPFLPAACNAFALIFRNLLKIAAINIVSISLLTIGKVTVALVTMGLFGYGFYAIEYLKNYVESPIVPSVIIFILSYTVASLFLVIFESVIDTIFFCFLVDCECNPKGKMLASKGLQKLVGKYSKKSAKRAQLEMKRRKERTEKLINSSEESDSDYDSDDDI